MTIDTAGRMPRYLEARRDGGTIIKRKGQNGRQTGLQVLDRQAKVVVVIVELRDARVKQVVGDSAKLEQRLAIQTHSEKKKMNTW